MITADYRILYIYIYIYIYIYNIIYTYIYIYIYIYMYLLKAGKLKQWQFESVIFIWRRWKEDAKKQRSSNNVGRWDTKKAMDPPLRSLEGLTASSRRLMVVKGPSYLRGRRVMEVPCNRRGDIRMSNNDHLECNLVLVNGVDVISDCLYLYNWYFLYLSLSLILFLFLSHFLHHLCLSFSVCHSLISNL